MKIITSNEFGRYWYGNNGRFHCPEKLTSYQIGNKKTYKKNGNKNLGQKVL